MAHLTREEEATLSRRIQAGDLDARNQLVERNLGFAYFVAKQYYDLGLTSAEVRSAACFGLMTAAERFIARPN
ncbi:MAG: sigma-70 factor domain-containing protein, partial [Patescibacteria group bacterium]